MDQLTSDEAKWLIKLQALIMKQPGNRLGFYTTGDNCITAFLTHHSETAFQENDDLVRILNRDGGNLEGGSLYFKNRVEGVCG